MIGTGIEVRVKIQDIVSSQLPSFILSEAPLTDDFLKQFYISQEFQGGPIDFATNLDQYLDLNNTSSEALYGTFELTEDVSADDTVVYVNTTKSFPPEWGLLKVDDEIMTYTGITTNSFTGVVRGFSGVTSLHAEGNPSDLVFQTSEAAGHLSDAPVENLSTLFLKVFFDQIRSTFAPGFEDLDVADTLNVGNWIRNVRSFFQTKGSEESIIILFKVLYGETPKVIDLENFLIKPSTAEYSRRDYAVCIPVTGNPINLKGRTIFEVDNPSVFGAVSEIETFTRDQRLYYRIYFFVSNDEIGNEKKLFTVPARTYAQRPWNPGDTTITVDSTIGFRNNGKFITQDGVEFQYEQKSVNQFLGITCSDPKKTILIKDEIIDNIVVSGTSSDGDTITVRLTGVISDLSFGKEVPFNYIGEKIRVDTLGENILGPIGVRGEQTVPQIIANSFIYNTSVRFEVREFSGTTFTLSANFLDKASLAPGDTVDILQRGGQIAYVTNRLVDTVDFINSTVTIDDSFGIPTDQPLDIRRNQKYANSTGAPIDYGNDAVLTSVLNLYDAREFDSNYYVATNSLPSYEITANIVESTLVDPTVDSFEDYNSFTGEYSIILFPEEVEFYTGDLITYSVLPGTTPLVDTGEYYVQVLEDRRKIRLFVSPSFIGSTSFVGFVDPEQPGTHLFTLESQRTREITTKRTYRKIPVSDSLTAIDRTPEPTTPGAIAVLTNGVEIISYKSPDKVYLGPIEKLDAVSGGEGYSVISPPEVSIEEPDVLIYELVAPPVLPSRAYGTPVVKGTLQEIVIDPQDFDIDQAFSITVRGGNSRGATAIPVIERKNRSIPFDSRVTDLGGGVNYTDNSILFQKEHNLAEGDAVIYNNKGAKSIGTSKFAIPAISGGTTLSNGGIYYAEILNNKTIRLYTSLDKLEDGDDPVFLSENLNGYGVQAFDTLRKNTIIGATISDDGGFFYYRNMQFDPSNVFTAYNEIRYFEHGFESGDIVEYGTTGSPIGGLSTSNQYYVYKIDDNILKLSDAGIGATISSNYDRLDFVDFTSIGVGTHNIKYPDITTDVVVSYASTLSGQVVVNPVIRGSIEQVYTTDGGYYGSDITNFQKNPNVTLKTGQNATIVPSIVEGKISSVQIFNSGFDYADSPDLVLEDSSGFGVGGKLRAVVVDGKIDDVIIINEGLGYGENTTKIRVVDPGRDALIIPRIRDLTINLYTRFGFEVLSQNNYRIVSYDRKLREDIYKDFGNFHSPIIGWANDGNPIYGGFGFSDPRDTNSNIRAMQTAYVLAPQDVFGRPTQTSYPAGFFIEDYKYVDDGDLDEYNGRYCSTPEFPNGVYAYFAGIDSDEQSSAREPQFPYFIGPEFRDSPIDPSSTNIDQDFDVNDKPIFRNTFPYYVGSPVAGSEFLDQSYLFDTQDQIVESISPGFIDGIAIVGAGNDYSVGDVPIFDSSEDFISSVVTEVVGFAVSSVTENTLSYSKEITKVIRLDQSNVRIYVDPVHEYSQNDSVIISGLSTVTSVIGGSRIVNLDNTSMTLYNPVPPIGTEGVTDIFVNFISSNVSVGSSIIISSGGNSEVVSVLNIFPVNKALRVFRSSAFGTEAPIGAVVFPVKNFFDVTVRTEPFESELDVNYFFNPRQTFSTSDEVGDTTEKVYSIGNIDYPISIPAGTIYAPSHEFKNLEEVVFTKPAIGAPVQVKDSLGNIKVIPQIGDEETLYVHNVSKDLIGIRFSPEDEDLLILSDGSDLFRYNISTRRFAETANLDRLRAKIATLEPHQLENSDLVDVTVVPFGPSGIGSNSSIVVEFDDVSQSLIVDPTKVIPSNIDTVLNLITIPNHRFILADYILYTTQGDAIDGLIPYNKYFVIPFDSNRFYLAETEVDTKIGSENPIQLNTQGTELQVFAKVNPEINIISDHDILFDVSSPSLFGKELKFFYDQSLTEVFDNNSIDRVFVVSGVSTEGYADGEKRIRYSTNNPGVIYYGLESGGYISTADTNAISYSSISYINSTYSISGTVTVESDRIFSVSLPERPEVSSYIPEGADLSYLTSSENTVGPVGTVRIISSGKNFDNLPEFITIQSETGSNASLRASSTNIGEVSSFRIQNPGWAYSADRTLRPKGIVQPSIEFTDSDFVTSIDVLDGGIGYQSDPNGVLVDSVTREPIDSGSIFVQTQSSKVVNVELDVAPSGLSKNAHEFFTTDNSNGVPILQVLNQVANVGTGYVDFLMQTPILGYFDAPFAVGDRVFVENIFSVTQDDEINMNSSEYGYLFFDVIAVQPSNPVVIRVAYPQGLGKEVGIAATFQNAFSSIVNEKIYPQFQVNQTTAVFVVGERLSLIDNGVVQETDLVVEESNTNFFKIKGNFNLLIGDSVRGNVSGIRATVTSIDKSFCRYKIETISRTSTGWNDTIGFINDEFQVIPDNNYYQNLSYSIQSTINFDDLIGPVNRLVHPMGLKNFSDTRIESSGFVGFGTTAISTDTSLILDFIGLTDVSRTPLRVDRINVFDLGYDDNVINNKTNAIRFNSSVPYKRLTDYIEVKTNRVLLIDNISNEFVDSDNLRGQNEFIEFDVVTDIFTSGIVQVRNPATDEVQLSEIISLTYDDKAFTMNKADVYDSDEPHGAFKAKALFNSDYSLRFTPSDPETFDMDLKLLVQKFETNSLPPKQLGFITLGGVINTIPADTTQIIYAAPNVSVDAVALHVFVLNGSGIPSYYEVYAFSLGLDTYSAVYSFDGIAIKDVSDPGYDFQVTLNSGRLRVAIVNSDSNIIRVETKEIEFKPTSSGENPVPFKKDNIPDGAERGINLLSTRVTGTTTDASIDVLTLDVNLFQSAKVVAHIQGTTLGAIHQVMTVNSDGSTYTNAYPFITEGDFPDNEGGIGEFISEIVGTDWILRFIPDAGGNPPETINITSYVEAFYREYDVINYDPRPLLYQSNQEFYELDLYNAPLGTRTNKVRFPLEYQGIPIYEKVFDPIDSIDIAKNIIEISSHFFSGAEELYYVASDSVDPEIADPIEIVPVTDYLGNLTGSMPSKVWAIKLDLNRFQVAASQEDAINKIPIEFIGIGSGNAHIFGMEKKLEKSLFTLDGVIQAPIATTNFVYELTDAIDSEDELLTLAGIGTLSSGDILLIDEEYVLIDNVGFSTSPFGPISNSGSIPLVRVERGIVGSIATSHSANSDLDLYRGNYNIVASDIIFTQAPNGRGPQQPNANNLVVTNSTFQGRTFLQQDYSDIAVFDDISDQFDGNTNEFVLTSNGIATAGVENGGGVLVINDIYQTPTTDNNEGNNYFFTGAQQVAGYFWSDSNDVATAELGEIRLSADEAVFGVNDADANGVDRSNYFLAINNGASYTIAVKYATGEFSYRGEKLQTLNTIKFVNGSIVAGVVPLPGTINGTPIEVTFTPDVPQSSVVFTGITSENGQRVQSEFDINQTQIPRGGLIVSLGSTPGLGYAPLYDAILEPEVSGGGIVGVFTDNTFGPQTDVVWAEYNNDTGELLVTALGVNVTGLEPISGADYLKESGRLIINTPASLSGQNIVRGDIIQLQGILFSCSSGGAPSTQFFPDQESVFSVENVITDNTFSVNVGISTIDHVYVSSGTWQKFRPFEFGDELLNPSFAALNGLTFECPSGQTAGLTTTIFPTPGVDNFPVIDRLDDAHFNLQVGLSTLVHNYVSGGTIGQITKNNVGSGYNRTVAIGVTEKGHTGVAASIRGVPGPGGELQIVIDNPGTGYVNPYIWAPSPSYFNLPIKTVFRRDGSLVGGNNLFITATVGGARTTAIGRSEYFEVIAYEVSNQGYGFAEGDIIEVVGIVTDKSLTEPIDPFQLTVLDTFTDNFAYWNYGQQDYIDSIAPFQDGSRTRFPLIYNGEQFSFEKDPEDEDSDAIDLSSILLIYVNTVLQTPNINYFFEGGTSFEFSSAPLPEDDIDIYFYRGKRDLDSATVTDVNETVRPGDQLQIKKNDVFDGSKTQDIRLVTEIASSDTARTNVYVGNNDINDADPRQVAWDKQKRDIFIYGQPIFKTRDSIESIIRPDPAIIAPLTPTSSTFYIDSPQLFRYETSIIGSVANLSKITGKIYSQPNVFISTGEEFVEAAPVANVDASGRVTGISFIGGNNGRGYPSNTTINIAEPRDGVRALIGTISISPLTGSLDFIQISNLFDNTGYDPANPPAVLIESPTIIYEDEVGINGDFIRGYSAEITAIQGGVNTIRFTFNKLDQFELINSLFVGDYVVMSETVIGNGVEAVGANALDVVGVGTQFLDCVYKVQAVSFQSSTEGFIDVNVRTNQSAVSGTGNLGYMSFGAIGAVDRDFDESLAFDIPNPVYTPNMTNFPTLSRTKGGLRDRGGLGKQV